jgi:hypothetical protein
MNSPVEASQSPLSHQNDKMLLTRLLVSVADGHL